MEKMGKVVFALALFSFWNCLALVSCAPPLFLQEKDSNHHRPMMVVGTYRLDRTVIPEHYDFEIQPILDEDPEVGRRFTAPGKVSITVVAQVAAKHITFHSVTINITESSVKLLDKNNVAQQIVNQGLDGLEQQTYTINLQNQLKPGEKYTLYIEFVAPVSQDRTNGLYVSRYTDDDNETRYLAATDFESVDFRRMIPSFDEPDLKATWKITVIHQRAYHSMSNMDLEISEAISENWVKDVYNEVEKMSTYLVALAVSDYKSEVANETLLDGRPVKIWGPPPLMRQGAGVYAADLSAKLLEFFEKHLNASYTFPKMEKIALQDFAAGAMENWGLNTYRIARLMWIEGVSTIQDKVSMTSTIAHELAHQWFGDLVTMKWWDDIWLNEGFATYFATLAVSDDTLYPDYGLDDYIIIDSIQAAFKADVQSSTHPLHPSNIDAPATISVLFDTITYDKGASILRMTNQFLTQPIFTNALTSYLQAKRSSNAHQDDLFQQFDEAVDRATSKPPLPDSGANVARILNEWTTKDGFPLVKVDRVGNVITISQEPFVGDYTVPPVEPVTWIIPITVETKTSTGDPMMTQQWLESASSQLTLVPQTGDYVVVNPQQTGYYRVKYDNASLYLIIEELNTVDLDQDGKLDHKTRSALIDDTFNLVFAGYPDIEIEDALSVTKYLSKEKKLVPWLSFVNNMATSYKLLGRTGGFVNFRKYVLRLMTPAIDHINIEPQPMEKVADATLLRNRLFEWTCNLGYENCINFANAQVEGWRNDTSKNVIFPDLRPHVYCSAVTNSGDKDGMSAFIFEQYKLSTSDTEQTNLLRALACAKETYRLTNLLEMVLNDNSGLRPTHIVSVMQYVAGNSVGADLTFTFIRNNFATIVSKFGASAFASVVSTLSGSFSQTFELSDLTRFIDENKDQLQGVQNSLDASKVAIQKNIDWMTTYYSRISQWMNSFVANTA